MTGVLCWVKPFPSAEVDVAVVMNYDEDNGGFYKSIDGDNFLEAKPVTAEEFEEMNDLYWFWDKTEVKKLSLFKDLRPMGKKGGFLFWGGQPINWFETVSGHIFPFSEKVKKEELKKYLAT